MDDSFVKLTNMNGCEIYLRISAITMVSTGKQGTIVRCNNVPYCYVKESVEEVIRLIDHGRTA